MHVALFAAGMLIAGLAPTDESKPAIDRVAQVELPEMTGLARGEVLKPREIGDAVELEKAFPDEDGRGKIARLVDFATHRLVYFTWAGSGQDRLTVKAGDAKNEIVFAYKAGLTRDLRSHRRLYAVPRDVAWSVSKVEP